MEAIVTYGRGTHQLGDVADLMEQSCQLCVREITLFETLLFCADP